MKQMNLWKYYDGKLKYPNMKKQILKLADSHIEIASTTFPKGIPRP
jgi:hypothetical protein